MGARQPEDVSLITLEQLQSWLDTYRRAWETRDAGLVVTLFTDDATYQETPFAEPMRGRDAIHAYWIDKVVNHQEQINFGYEILAVRDDTGIARWWARFVRIRSRAAVKLDGVFLLTFDASGRCQALREWWVRQDA